ncbi:Lipase [Macleaya cordata]|uniref:Lipase n=1 Tax=Macleaya cordata TaxID=56857 RepID=A0A200R1V4_MACCD|nr:Lipase [Macleaya cordata]
MKMGMRLKMDQIEREMKKKRSAGSRIGDGFLSVGYFTFTSINITNHDLMMRIFLLLLPMMMMMMMIMVISSSTVVVVESTHCDSPVIFNFGDSNSDTGGYSAGLGIPFGPPNGRTFFHTSTGGRLSDGRLIIDFLCESLHSSYLTPYLESLDPNFRNGANFAISGSSTLPEYVPFALDIQILQFVRFRSRSIDLVSRGKSVKNFVDEEGFQNAIYTFDIGQNDLAGAFSRKLSYEQVIENIPSYIAEIKYALWNIYQHGGKNFWIHNTGPFGCLPQRLATTSPIISTGDLDQYGCIRSLNDAAKVFNEGLRALCEELRSEMKNAILVYTDIFAIKYDLIANASKYGFENPLMACCGYGGPPYNVNSTVGCGQTGYNVCTDGSKYISWDGVHYSEAANSMVASKILSTNYSTPQLKFDYFYEIDESHTIWVPGTIKVSLDPAMVRFDLAMVRFDPVRNMSRLRKGVKLKNRRFLERAQEMRDKVAAGFLIDLVLVLLISVSLLPIPTHSAAAVHDQCKKNPIIFSFGDSNTDTGGLVSGLGFNVNLPNGRSFFGRSTGRLSDGRLVIDFLCESLNSSYLSPYLDSLAGSDFRNGANFAVVGSSTLPKFVPFALNIQVMQFQHFKAHSLDQANTKGSRRFIDDQGFKNALYVIDIGQNDLADTFSKNLSYARVIRRIPLILAEIKTAIKTIYDEGGKNFWIHNTGPLGCLPQMLSLVRAKIRVYDLHGCIRTYNDAAKAFNEGLRVLCAELRSELKNTTIIYVDIYNIKYDLVANSTKYGFNNPLMACCGHGGPPYNYNSSYTCGHPRCGVCEEGSRYISWDGTHYTEAANTIVASKIFSTTYSTPQLKFDYFCRA